MSLLSKIEWTDATWNPVRGCTKVSPGCKHCYAERMARRLHAMGSCRYVNNFDPTLHWDLIEVPLRWKRPRIIFVNSMSDLFQEDVPFEFIERVFDLPTLASVNHQFDSQTPGTPFNDAANGAPYGPPAPPRDNRTEIGDMTQCFEF